MMYDIMFWKLESKAGKDERSLLIVSKQNILKTNDVMMCSLDKRLKIDAPEMTRIMVEKWFYYNITVHANYGQKN